MWLTCYCYERRAHFCVTVSRGLRSEWADAETSIQTATSDVKACVPITLANAETSLVGYSFSARILSRANVRLHALLAKTSSSFLDEFRTGIDALKSLVQAGCECLLEIKRRAFWTYLVADNAPHQFLFGNRDVAV